MLWSRCVTQLFGGKLLLIERHLYDSIEHAMITVFIVITGEQWNTLWMQTQREVTDLGIVPGLFYVSLVGIGEYILLNLVIAIVITEVVAADALVREQNGERAKLTGNALMRNGKMRVHGEVVLESDAIDDEDEDEDEGMCEPCTRPFSSWLEARKEYSLLLFAPGSGIRRVAHWAAYGTIPGTPIGLESIIITTIIISSAAVAFDAGCDLTQPHDSLHDTHREMPHELIAYLSFATIVSLIELVAKVIANGLLTTQNAYFKSGWNQLDAAITILCIGELVDTGLPAGLVLRSIHALRPLRLIARVPGLQQVIMLLFEIMPRVGNILLVYCLFLAIFSVLGVQLFAGKLGACASDDSYTTKASCLAAGEQWENSPYGSFDNVGAAALLLFEVSSLEGWQNAMYLGIDAVGVDVAGRLDYNMVHSLFFIAWVFLGGFVVLNVFVGVLIDTFATMNTLQRFGGIFTSHEQQHWVETLEAATIVRPQFRSKPPVGSPCRVAFYNLVTSKRFESAILGVILLNTACMAADGYDAPASLHGRLDQLNDACTAVFIAEAVVKMYAHGPITYMRDPWNAFDFVVVAAAIGEKVVLAAAGTNVKGSFLRVARLARAARVLRTMRMVKSSRAIRSLLTTLLYSLPPLANIMGIFVILMFTYAVLGMELFSGVMWGRYLSAEANFCSFTSAMLTMFRCATGEDWNGIMHDAMVTPDRGCDPSSHNCGTWLAIPYFVTYTILTSFVVLKMLIALIIENFKLSMREDARLVRTAHRDAFVEAWALFDTDGDGRLAVSELPALMRILAPPLGPDPRDCAKGAVKDRDITMFILSLDIAAYEPKGGGKVVLFHDLLLALTTRALAVHTTSHPHHSSEEAMGPAAAGADGHGDGEHATAGAPSAQPLKSRTPSPKHERAGRASSQADGNDPLRRTLHDPMHEGDVTLAPLRKTAQGGMSAAEPTAARQGSGTLKQTVNEALSQSLTQGTNLFTLRSIFVEKAKVEHDVRPPSARRASQAGIAFSMQAEYSVLLIQNRWRMRKWNVAKREALRRGSTGPPMPSQLLLRKSATEPPPSWRHELQDLSYRPPRAR